MEDIGEKFRQLLNDGPNKEGFSNLKNLMIEKEGPEQYKARLMMAIECLSSASIIVVTGEGKDGKGGGNVMASVHPADMIPMVRAVKKLIKELSKNIKEELDVD